MAEVRLCPMTRRMTKRNKRLATIQASLLHIATHPIVAARVTVFSTQPTEELSRRMPLLTRRLLIGRHDGVDHHAKGTEHRCRPGLFERVGRWLRFPQGLEHGLRRMAELFHNLPDRQAIPTSLTNPSEMIHREHPFPLG